MDTRTRFILGGVGGLAPIILFLINLDWDRYVAEASTWTTAGYVVRTILLFALGGFVAYLHEKEQKPITLFLVGVSAPALIAGYISTANPVFSQYSYAQPQKAREQKKPDSASNFFIRSALAEPLPSTNSAAIKHFTLPPQSAASQFVEGLLGVAPRNVWFVIVGSHLDQVAAEKQAEKINRDHSDYHADVYAPYQGNPYYAVVIGANLTQQEARNLRDRAIRDGFPDDSYYKTFPGLPPAN